MIDWSKYEPIFTRDEFACKCGCGRVDMRKELIDRLHDARLVAGIPFVITSGYRCENHNMAVGGVHHSAHTTGHAADIRAADMMTRMKVLDGLVRAGVPRIGISRHFLHADVDWDSPLGVYLY